MSNAMNWTGDAAKGAGNWAKDNPGTLLQLGSAVAPMFGMAGASPLLSGAGGAANIYKNTQQTKAYNDAMLAKNDLAAAPQGIEDPEFTKAGLTSPGPGKLTAAQNRIIAAGAPKQTVGDIALGTTKDVSAQTAALAAQRQQQMQSLSRPFAPPVSIQVTHGQGSAPIHQDPAFIDKMAQIMASRGRSFGGQGGF